MPEHGTTTKRADGTIMTFTGRLVRPLAITADDLDIRDIAHALSMKCRYTGHCRSFYSVGQHSVLMARQALPGPAVWRLLHDASEAYLPDIASPIKDQFTIIKEAEARILAAVSTRFGLPPYAAVYREVHEADVAMMVWEGQWNMNDKDYRGSWWRPGISRHVIDQHFCAWLPQETEENFLKEAECLLEN